MDVEKLNKGECEPLEKNLVSDDQVTTKPNKKRLVKKLNHNKF